MSEEQNATDDPFAVDRKLTAKVNKAQKRETGILINGVKSFLAITGPETSSLCTGWDRDRSGTAPKNLNKSTHLSL